MGFYFLTDRKDFRPQAPPGWPFRWLCRTMVLAILAGISGGITGCGGASDEVMPGNTPSTAPVASGPAPEGSGPEPRQIPPVASDPTEGISDPSHRALAGTAWRAGDHRLWFLDADRVRIVSPKLEPYAPGGLITRYHLENGIITINVMGNEIRLEWDGTQLKAQGMPAERAD